VPKKDPMRMFKRRTMVLPILSYADATGLPTGPNELERLLSAGALLGADVAARARRGARTHVQARSRGSLQRGHLPAREPAFNSIPRKKMDQDQRLGGAGAPARTADRLRVRSDTRG
jgi:hypothetical protein